MTVAFAGESARTAPLTWGQRHIWRSVLAASPCQSYLNLSRVVAVPTAGADPVDVSGASAAVGRLIGRHEALRTRLTGPDDDPRQCVEERGTVPVEIVESERDGVADATERVRARLAEAPFDAREEWPVRVAFVVAGGTVRRVVLVLSHLAVDGQGAEIVHKDLDLLLRGALPVRSAPQPADDAVHQSSERGVRTGGRAIRFWADEHRRISPASRRLGAAPCEPRLWEATVHSTAMDLAAHTIAARHGVSSSVVLATASMGLTAALTGQRVLGMRPIVSNRFYPDRRDVVATIVQEGLLVLDVGVPTFGELVSQAWRVAMRAYRFARYDPREMDRMMSTMDSSSFGHFTDQRLGHQDTPDPPVPEAEELRAAAERTTVAWTSTMDSNVTGFLVRVAGGDGRLAASLRADTALLAPRDIEAYLLALEALLVEAALREVELAELPGLLARSVT